MINKRIIGIDAGGTKTELVLCDGEGRAYGRAFRGTGNPNDIGVDACASMIADGIRELCGSDAPDAIFAGISGAGSGDNAERIKNAINSRYPAAVVEVRTDASNLLASGKSEGDCAALICGTGTALFVQKDNIEYRIGGWGYLFDLGGSAYDLGRDAIRASLASEEGLIPEGELCRRVREKLGAESHIALADIYKGGKAYIASFARIAVECAERGDEAAVAIVEDSIRALSKRVEKAISLYGALPEIVCGGGLFNSEYFTALLRERLDEHGVALYIPTLPLSFGSCVRAASLVGSVNKQSFAENFGNTLSKNKTNIKKSHFKCVQN